jgi:hypothetical protein
MLVVQIFLLGYFEYDPKSRSKAIAVDFRKYCFNAVLIVPKNATSIEHCADPCAFYLAAPEKRKREKVMV